jgi:hypothetical protein
MGKYLYNVIADRNLNFKVPRLSQETQNNRRMLSDGLWSMRVLREFDDSINAVYPVLPKLQVARRTFGQAMRPFPKGGTSVNRRHGCR